MNGRLHAQDGVCFTREADGSVALECVAGPSPEQPGGLIIERTVFTREQWASIIAHVSAKGETTESWRAALDWHNES